MNRKKLPPLLRPTDPGFFNQPSAPVLDGQLSIWGDGEKSAEEVDDNFEKAPDSHT